MVFKLGLGFILFIHWIFRNLLQIGILITKQLTYAAIRKLGVLFS
jgi:hypothetical protein